MFGGKMRMFRTVATTALMLSFFVGVGLVVQASIPSIAYAQSSSQQAAAPSSFVMLIGNTLAQFIDFIGNAVGSLTLVIIEVIVVNVLNYNNFASSNIVNLGWTLTRDMVNMFAVVVLLVLAVKTMIEQRASAWQQHLPRFFLGIVFANFSRTLCGLAVDASQIVMMTFVNALMSIAAGNFAQLMVMPEATTYSSATFQGASEAGITIMTLAANIANAYVKLLVQVVVMVVMLLLAIAFIWRIVILWIAFIMAPFAAFSWGSKEIVGYLGRVYQEWVSTFVPPLVLGPMLAFFLYLALAASSNGNLAKTEAFPEPEKRTTYGQITLEVFESTNFTGLLIAVVFLMLGLRESAKVSSKMGGLASMALNEKTGKRVFSLGARVSGATVGNVGKAVARTGSLAVRGAGVGVELAANKLGEYGGAGIVGGGLKAFGKGVGQTARGVDNFVKMAPTNVMNMPDYAKRQAAAAGDQIKKGVIDPLAKGIAENTPSIPRFNVAKGDTGFRAGAARLANDVLNSGGRTFNGVMVNPLLAASSALGYQEHHMSEAEQKAAKERVAHMSDREKIQRLLDAQRGTGENSLEAVADAEYMKGLVFSDKSFEKLFNSSVTNADERIGEFLEQYQHEADGDHLSIDKETWNKARSKYIDLYAQVDAGKAEKFIDSEDFNGRLMRDEAIDPARAGSVAVIRALENASTNKTEDGRVITKLDELNRGNYGHAKKSPGLASTVPGVLASGDREEIGRIVTRGGADHMRQTDLASPVVIQSLIEKKIDPRQIATVEVAGGGVTRAMVEQEFVTQIMNTQEVENITRAFDNKQFNEGNLSDAMFDRSRNTNAANAVQALARAEKLDLAKANAAVVNQVRAELGRMEAAHSISADDANTLRKKMLNAGKTIADILPAINLASGKVEPSDRAKMQQLFHVDPSSIQQISTAVEDAVKANKPNDFTEAVVSGLSKEDFKKLSDMFMREADKGRKEAIKKAMKVIDGALTLHAKTPASPEERKHLNGLRSAHAAAERYMP